MAEDRGNSSASVANRTAMAEIPSEFQQLFAQPTIAHVTTLLPDGAPHTSPVWIDYDGATNRVLVNTERGRRKEKNVRQDPRVAVSMTDPDDPYRYLLVRGVVDEVTTEHAREHIDTLARRYIDDEYPGPIDTERVILSIEPAHVTHSDRRNR